MLFSWDIPLIIMGLGSVLYVYYLSVYLDCKLKGRVFISPSLKKYQTHTMLYMELLAISGEGNVGLAATQCLLNQCDAKLTLVSIPIIYY